MKTLYRRLTSSILLAFITLSVIAQSISGNVSSFESETTFGYATVDIHKGKVLVASVLTDDAGAFDVKLDTGTYKAVINFHLFLLDISKFHSRCEAFR